MESAADVISAKPFRAWPWRHAAEEYVLQDLEADGEQAATGSLDELERFVRAQFREPLTPDERMIALVRFHAETREFKRVNRRAYLALLRRLRFSEEWLRIQIHRRKVHGAGLGGPIFDHPGNWVRANY